MNAQKCTWHSKAARSVFLLYSRLCYTHDTKVSTSLKDIVVLTLLASTDSVNYVQNAIVSLVETITPLRLSSLGGLQSITHQ